MNRLLDKLVNLTNFVHIHLLLGESFDAVNMFIVRVAQRVGYLVTRVVCMGFLTSDTLQNMHNSAIEQRTKMKLNAETEEQEQRIADMKVLVHRHILFTIRYRES